MNANRAGKLLLLLMCVSTNLFFYSVIGAASGYAPHGGMMRDPDVSATQIVFGYANSLWLVPRAGGTAVPLAGPPGREMLPRFSADGMTVVFAAEYDGPLDLYSLPVTGGIPQRITHNPMGEWPCGWTPEGDILFTAWGFGSNPRLPGLFTVPAAGGLPNPVPVPYAFQADISADGVWLAYATSSSSEHTWKRYAGGQASDIWLFNLKNQTSKRLTNWMGTDADPMWLGNKLYFISNAGPSHIMNIWAANPDTGELRQVTTFTEYDVKSPSIGPGPNGQGEIVFQYGNQLMLLDLSSETSRAIPISVPGDRLHIRPRFFDVSPRISSAALSPSAKRVIVEARGDVWSLPAKDGTPLNLTRTSGVAEHEPVWSPDGKWLAYFSDATGEYELWVMSASGDGLPRQVSQLGGGYLFLPQWSPDSRRVAFWDQKSQLYVAEVPDGGARMLDRLPVTDDLRVNWSPDSRWLAYSKQTSSNSVAAIWLCDAGTGVKHQVTGAYFLDAKPTFDRAGKYLFYISYREFGNPLHSDQGETWVFSQTAKLVCVPLTNDIPSPLAPSIDEESAASESKPADDATRDKAAESGKDKEKKKKDKQDGKESDAKQKIRVNIDFDGFERRGVVLPPKQGMFRELDVTDEGHLIFLRRPLPLSDNNSGTIYLLDLDPVKIKDGEKTVIDGVDGFVLSTDGKKLLVGKGDSLFIVDARAEQKLETPVPVDGMRTLIDPAQEWRQIFHEAWRIERDFFYDPNMHGVDWLAMRQKYEPLLADCATRDDAGYVINEMISELNVGHLGSYGPWGNDEGLEGAAEGGGAGTLGCDFQLFNGAYRIVRIYEGGPWDADGRGPLSQPGVGVREGDYLLAVNGIPVDPGQDPWAALVGLAGKRVTLTVSSEPKLGKRDRRVVVELRHDEYFLRYRAWIERNRSYVAERTGGRVGYIHIPDTHRNGASELMRQFLGQRKCEALIFDVRCNGGGSIPVRMVELINRPVVSYWSVRNVEGPIWSPDESHQGPKCMIINGWAGSGGDMLPYLFRAAGLGKLIGSRTWGGLVGIGGSPRHIDGSTTTAPSFAFYEIDGTWGIEGFGVAPDIDVPDDPALMVGGQDPQLDAAINHMLDELAERPFRPVPTPPFPIRTGMGITDADK